MEGVRGSNPLASTMTDQAVALRQSFLVSDGQTKRLPAAEVSPPLPTAVASHPDWISLTLFLIAVEILQNHALGDLAGGRPWQLVYLVELARYLEQGQICLQELLEFAYIELHALVHAVEAGAGLAAQLILYTDDRDFRYARELVYELLDLAWVYVLAHADDHILDAVDDVDVAVGVGPHDVARVQPAAAQRLFRSFLEVPVAEHDIGAPDDELARLAERHLAAVAADDAPVDIRHDGADGAGPRIVPWIHRDDRRCLGEPVALADRRLEFIAEILLDLLRQRRAARDDEAQRLHVLLAGELREQRAYRGHDAGIGDAFVTYRRDGLLRREGIEDDDARARVERIEHRAGPAEAVVHRQHAERAVICLHVQARPDLLDIRDEVAMREHGPFRRAGRAARIDDDAGIIDGEKFAERRRRLDPRLRRATVPQVVLRDLQARAHRCEGVDEMERLARQQMLDPGILQYIGRLAARQLEIDRHSDSTEADDAQIRIYVFGTVARENAYAVSLPHTDSVEPVPAGPHGLRQLLVGHAAVMVYYGDIARAALVYQVMYIHCSLPHFY